MSNNKKITKSFTENFCFIFSFVFGEMLDDFKIFDEQSTNDEVI